MWPAGQSSSTLQPAVLRHTMPNWPACWQLKPSGQVGFLAQSWLQTPVLVSREMHRPLAHSVLVLSAVGAHGPPTATFLVDEPLQPTRRTTPTMAARRIDAPAGRASTREQKRPPTLQSAARCGK